MKRSCFKKLRCVFLLTCLLFLQLGCEEQLQSPQESVTALTESKPALTQPEPAPTAPKPPPTRTKPPAIVQPGPTKSTAPPPPITPPRPRPPAVKAIVDPNQPRPSITFDKVMHDFGNVGPRTRNVHHYKFTNTGDAKLQISSVRACCGVVAKLVGNKRDYTPGENGEVELQYTSAVQPTTVNKTVYVYSNDTARPKVGLSFKARIVMKVDHEPKRLNLLLNKENAACPDITLKSLDNQPFAIKNCRSTGDGIVVDYDPSVKQTQFVFKPKVDVEKLRSSLSGRIDIELTHPECSSVTIYYSVLAKFRINPPSLVLFKAEPNKPVKRTVYVLSNYKEDFEIESATSQKNIINVLNQKKIPNGYQFDLEITPPPVDRKIRIFTDVFSVQLKDGEKMAITCRGFYDSAVVRPSGR